MIYENGFYDVEVAQEARLFDFDDDADFSVKRSPQPKSRRFAIGSTLFSSPTGGFSIPYTNRDSTKTGGVHPRSMPVLIPSSVDNLKNIIQNKNSGSNNNNNSGSESSSLTMRQAVEVETPLSGDCGSPDWCSERALLTLDDLQSRQLHNNRHNQQQQQHYHHHHHHHYHQTRQAANLSVSTADSMLTLEELKDHFSSCFTCGVSWNEEHVSLDCFECGGYSMERPCPICDGKCNRTWRRDITMTHALRKAHWEGECGLVMSQDRDTIFLKNLVDATEESISKALKDLSASS